MAACSICSTHYLASERVGTSTYVQRPCPNEHLHTRLLKYKRINQQMQTGKENREVFYSRIDRKLKDILKQKLGIESKRKRFEMSKKRKKSK